MGAEKWRVRTFRVAVTLDERRMFLAAAEAAGMPVSTWVRGCALAALGLPVRIGVHGSHETMTRDTGRVVGRRPSPRTLAAAKAAGIRAEAAPPPACPKGHRYTPSNTMHSQGTRKCRACNRLRSRQ